MADEFQWSNDPMDWNFGGGQGAPVDASIDAQGYQDWVSGSTPMQTPDVSNNTVGYMQTPWQQYTSQHEAQYEIPKQERTWGQWWDQNTSGQLGVDNAFRLGSIGLSGLGMAGALDQQNKARKAHSSALSFLDSQKDPNSNFYRQRLADIMSDRNGYLTDVTTQNKLNTLRETLMRQNSLQGQGSLNADQVRALQDAGSSAYRDERDTLIKLRERDAQLQQYYAQLMAQAPTASPISAVMPGLTNIFNTGQEYVISQGYGSDPNLRTPSAQARFQNSLNQRTAAVAGRNPAVKEYT